MYKTVFYIMVGSFLLLPFSSFAGVDLPWSTTYNCAEWTTYLDPLSCDGLDKGLNLALGEEITTAANYPGGAGGKGQRHWLVTSHDVGLAGSGGLRLKLNATTPKLWIRWYMRFENGAWSESWTNYKAFFVETDTSSTRFMVGYHAKGQVGIVGSSPNRYTAGGFGVDFYLSGTSDGSWHCFEIMMDFPNKHLSYWVDGTLKLDETVDNFYSNGTGIDRITIGSNIKYKSGTNYIDYDDITISTTGYIGPITTQAPPVQQETNLLHEPFENNNFTSRNWYDSTANQIVDSNEHAPVNGSTKSGKYHFAKGAKVPSSGAAMRHKFAATDDFYVEYWVKYSAGHQGSGGPNHPHEFFIMSNYDSDNNSPNYPYLQVKIEQNGLKPRVIIRDDKFVNTTKGTIPSDLTKVTDQRATCGCNGEQDGHPTDCYQSNGKWYNGKHFLYNTKIITDNKWHKIKVHIKLNTLSGAITNKDGIMQYWLDDKLIFNYNDLIMRTPSRADIKFNQFGIAPYIGVGSPIEQTMWVDELKIYTVTQTQSLMPLAPTNFLIKK